MGRARTAIVTGVDTGIGLETARGLSDAGFRTLLLCADPRRAAAAKADIDTTVRAGHTEVVRADLASLADVRRAVDELDGRIERLDLLVNNTAVALRRPQVTDEGFDTMLAANHLGPFLLTNLLLPKMRAAPYGRIINVSGDGHRRARLHLDDLNAPRSYGLLGSRRSRETRLMKILFTRELARRLRGSEITANCLDPGLDPGRTRARLRGAPAMVRAIVERFQRSPEQGARASLAAALDPFFAGVTGSYLVKERRRDDHLPRVARDDEAAARLWAVSETLTGLA